MRHRSDLSFEIRLLSHPPRYGSLDHETLDTELPDLFKPAIGTVDLIPGTALFTQPDDDGKVAY